MDGWINGRHKLIRRKAHMNTNLFSLFSVSLQIRFQVCGKYRQLIITIRKENSVISFFPVHRLPQLTKSSNCLNPISSYTTLPTGRHSSCCFQQNGLRIAPTLKVSFTYNVCVGFLGWLQGQPHQQQRLEINFLIESTKRSHSSSHVK